MRGAVIRNTAPQLLSLRTVRVLYEVLTLRSPIERTLPIGVCKNIVAGSTSPFVVPHHFCSPRPRFPPFANWTTVQKSDSARELNGRLSFCRRYRIRATQLPDAALAAIPNGVDRNVLLISLSRGGPSYREAKGGDSLRGGPSCREAKGGDSLPRCWGVLNNAVGVFFLTRTAKWKLPPR